MNFGEYIRRPMTADAKLPKILLFNSPIPLIRSIVDPLANEFTFVLAGDSEQLDEIINSNADISAFVICEMESNAQATEVLTKVRKELPNTARAIITNGQNLGTKEVKELLNQDLANQIWPENMTMQTAAIKLLELNQISKLKWQISQIEKIAATDPTTGLPNSRYFQSSMEVLIEKSLPTKTPFGLILVDVDQFRTFNETFGYGEGDKILEGIGDRMRSLIPECLNIFCLGSDEFAILVKVENAQKAHQLGEMVRRNFENIPFVGPNRRPAYVTVSVGVAVFPDHGVQYAEIMTTAKGALNQAKRRGRNQTVVSQLC